MKIADTNFKDLFFFVLLNKEIAKIFTKPSKDLEDQFIRNVQIRLKMIRLEMLEDQFVHF